MWRLELTQIFGYNFPFWGKLQWWELAMNEGGCKYHLLRDGWEAGKTPNEPMARGGVGRGVGWWGV